MTTIVTTQAELDAALKGATRGTYIEIRSVRAFDSASVRASGSASVSASGSASASVSAFGSASVSAFDSASVSATPKVAVHLHSKRVKVQGGVVIDVIEEPTDAAEWCEYHGVTVSKAGIATVYKAVDDNWVSGYGFNYAPGTKPVAPDWRDDATCGGGLHFSPSPTQALYYNESATRFLEVGVRVADLRPIPGGTAKCKAPAVVRKCVEVDVHGKRVSR